MGEQARFLLSVSFNTAVIYVFLVIAVRLVGRRYLGQSTPIDLLFIILLGSSVETAMVRSSPSLKAGLVSAITLLILNRLLTGLLSKSKKWAHLVGSGPILLIHNGHFVEENLKKIGLTKEDVIHAMHAKECSSLRSVRYAVFEPNGEINVVPMNGANLPSA